MSFASVSSDGPFSLHGLAEKSWVESCISNTGFPPCMTTSRARLPITFDSASPKARETRWRPYSAISTAASRCAKQPRRGREGGVTRPIRRARDETHAATSDRLAAVPFQSGGDADHAFCGLCLDLAGRVGLAI